MLLLGFVIVLQIALTQPRVASVILVAFLVRAVFVCYYTFWVPPVIGDVDPDGYWTRAVEWSAGGFREALRQFTTGAYFYSWVLAMLYSVTGPSLFLVRALNALFGSLIVWNVCQMSHLIWEDKTAVRAAWFVALFPNLILHSALSASREALTVYLATLSMLFFVRWYRGGVTVQVLYSCISMLFTISLHTGFILFPVCVFILMLARHARISPTERLQYFFSLSLVLAMIVYITRTGWGLDKLQGSVGNISADRLLAFQEGGAIGRAAYPGTLVMRTPVDYLWKTPLRIVYFLFTPFVWMVRTNKDILGLVDAFLYIWIAVALYRSRRRIWNDETARAVCLILAATLLLFALTVSNYGAAVRHRAKLLPIAATLVPIWSLRVEQKVPGRLKSRPRSAIGLWQHQPNR
jgi:hypothetical protein